MGKTQWGWARLRDVYGAESQSEFTEGQEQEGFHTKTRQF